MRLCNGIFFTPDAPLVLYFPLVCFRLQLEGRGGGGVGVERAAEFFPSPLPPYQPSSPLRPILDWRLEAKLRYKVIWTGSGLSESCPSSCICKLLDICCLWKLELRPTQSNSCVPSPLDDERCSIAVTFLPGSPLRRMKIDWTMDRTCK